jgi:hypothetical protein
MGVHTFDNQNNDGRSREIVGEALEFLKWHLRQGGNARDTER